LVNPIRAPRFGRAATHSEYLGKPDRVDQYAAYHPLFGLPDLPDAPDLPAARVQRGPSQAPGGR